MKTNLGKLLVAGLWLLTQCLHAQPLITNQPANQTVVWGGNATFNVAASGTGPFTYQWLKNGANVSLNGIINTVAGNGAAIFGKTSYGAPVSIGGTYSGDGGAATNAGLNYPFGVAVDAAGDLFIADTGNNRIRKVDTNGIMTTLAGNGTNGFSGDGGAATNASLNTPSSLAVDAAGNVFITDAGNSRIRKIDTNGIITTVAGNGGNENDLTNVLGEVATNVSLLHPNGVTVDAVGNLFIAEAGDNDIRKVDTNGIITTDVGQYYWSDPYPGDFYYPGQYYLYSYGSYSGDGGPAFNARLNQPCGVAVDAAGNLFIADSYNQRIRKVGTNCVSVVLLDQYNQKGGQVITSGIISTVAGGGTNYSFWNRGYGVAATGVVATNARLDYPCDVAVDAIGNLFTADANQVSVDKVGTNGIITVVAGNGSPGYSGDGGAATNASLYGHDGFYSYYMFNGLAVDAVGNLYITDTLNNRIRKVTFSNANLLTNGSLVLNNVSAADAGNYSVIITSASGSVTSSVVTVNLQLPPLAPAFTASNSLRSFTWSAVSNQTYQLQCATNLVPPSWIDLGSPVTATSNSVSASDTIGADGQRFYRVRSVP